MPWQWLVLQIFLDLSRVVLEDIMSREQYGHLRMLHEILPTIHERSNPYDCYAIAARKSLPGTLVVESTTSHLPKEISRLTCFIVLHGAVVIVKILNTQI